MESAVKVRALRERVRSEAEKKKKKSARRNRVKILIFMDIKKGFSALKPTPSGVNPCDGFMDAFLGDLPSPTRAAMAALPPAIGDGETSNAAGKCCCIQLPRVHIVISQYRPFSFLFLLLFGVNWQMFSYTSCPCCP